MHNAPVAWASSTDAIPMSRFSHTMLSVAASRVKSVNTGSYGSIHRSRGLLGLGELLPTDVKVRDDSPLALSTVDPSSYDVLARTPLW